MKTVMRFCFIWLFTLVVTNAFANEAIQLEKNKQTVMAFYQAALNEKDINKAIQFIGDRYIQHNPNAADGVQGLRAYVQFLREKFPDSQSNIKRIIAEGDYITLHVHALREKNTRGFAIIDIFKLENNKIVEHWDVIQEIPEKSANDNGMF